MRISKSKSVVFLSVVCVSFFCMMNAGLASEESKEPSGRVGPPNVVLPAVNHNNAQGSGVTLPSPYQLSPIDQRQYGEHSHEDQAALSQSRVQAAAAVASAIGGSSSTAPLRSPEPLPESLPSAPFNRQRTEYSQEHDAPNFGQRATSAPVAQGLAQGGVKKQWRFMAVDDGVVNTKVIRKALCTSFGVPASDALGCLAFIDESFIQNNPEHLYMQFVRTHLQLKQAGVNFAHEPVAHLIFIDLQMPEMNGNQLAAMIRKYEFEQRIETRSTIISWSSGTGGPESTMVLNAYIDAFAQQFKWDWARDPEARSDWNWARFSESQWVFNDGKPMDSAVFRQRLVEASVRYDMPRWVNHDSTVITPKGVSKSDLKEMKTIMKKMKSRKLRVKLRQYIGSGSYRQQANGTQDSAK